VRPVEVAGRTDQSGHSDRSEPCDEGMVTAELALALPALVLVVAMLVAVVGAASSVAKASDAARSAARAASIGTPSDQVLSSASRLAPAGSDIAVTSDEGWVTVSVSPPPVRIGPFSVSLPEVTGAAPVESALVGAAR
jgi:hypothetical protein